MQHDERSLVHEAHETARTQVEATGHVLPAAYLLTRINPQTGAELTYPTALASVSETPPKSPADLEDFVATVREEAHKLRALAVVFCAEAELELDDAGHQRRRAAVLRVEDHQGVQFLHAEIIAGETGHSLGALMSTGLEPDPERWLR